MNRVEAVAPTLRCTDGLDAVLGQYDGNASITTRVGKTDDHDLLGQVTWHELHHYGLQAGTPWGIAYSAMVRKTGELSAVAQSKMASVLRNATAVHEMYATYYTTGESAELIGLIEKNNRYLGYWSAANGLRIELFGDAPDWSASLELLFDKLMSGRRILELSPDSPLEYCEAILNQAAPDLRYKTLDMLVREEGQALLDLRQVLTKSTELATLDQHLSDVLTYYGIDCSDSDSQCQFLDRMSSGPRPTHAAISIDMGSSWGPHLAPGNTAGVQLIYGDALLQLSDIESLQLRETKRAIEILSAPTSQVGISDLVIRSKSAGRYSVTVLVISRSALQRQFELPFLEAGDLDNGLEQGILSAPLDENDSALLVRTALDGPLLKLLEDRHHISKVFWTTSSTPLSIGELPFDVEDLIVLIDGPRFAAAVALTRQWMFLSYRVMNLGTIPLTVVVACSGGAPSPRFVFVCTNITAQYLVGWFERQSSCALDNELDESGIAEVMTQVLGSFYRVGGYITHAERPSSD